MPGLTNRLLARVVSAAAVDVRADDGVSSAGRRSSRVTRFAPSSWRSGRTEIADGEARPPGARECWSLAVLRARTRSTWPWWRRRRSWWQRRSISCSPIRRASETWTSSASGYRRAGQAARVEPFLFAMAREMTAADLIVCRAGATTLAEIAAAGRPAILIPLPTATDDHQRKNAEVLAQAGAAEVLEQRDLTGSRLAGRIVAAGSAIPTRRRLMGGAARRLARPDAAARIVDRVVRAGGKIAARRATAGRHEHAVPDAQERDGVLGRTRRVHFVGIGGIGMSGIAELLVNLGYEVSGSDLKRSDVTDRLEALGVARVRGPRRRPRRRRGRRRVLVGGAPANPEIAEAARAPHPRHSARRDAGRADAAALRHRGRRRPRQDHDDVDDRRWCSSARASIRRRSSAAG